jgi:hypothetical protein
MRAIAAAVKNGVPLKNRADNATTQATPMQEYAMSVYRRQPRNDATQSNKATVSNIMPNKHPVIVEKVVGPLHASNSPPKLCTEFSSIKSPNNLPRLIKPNTRKTPPPTSI